MCKPNFPTSTFFETIKATTGITDQLFDAAIAEAGVSPRKPRKISPEDLLSVLCELSMEGTASYNEVAVALNAISGLEPSRQAVALRMNLGMVTVLHKLLNIAVAHKVSGGEDIAQTGFLAGFQRILIQDSTIIKLPAWLFADFSGVSNATSTVCNARLQVAYDLRNGCFEIFALDSYSHNDLAAAPSLPLRPGDLVLRDRGYLTVAEISRQIESGAHCIYRHKTGTIYRDLTTQEPLDLLRLLQKQRACDINVTLNDDERTPVRLIAAPVDQETAALRRMKAKKETKGHNPSAEVLALMDWTIFTTTIPADQASFKWILAVYGLRWRIEIIFKSWKSHLGFADIHRVSSTQLHLLIFARLLVITAMTNYLFKRCHDHVWRKFKRHVSLLKFLNYLAKNPDQIPLIYSALEAARPDDPALSAIRRYCCYDKRKRQNFMDIYSKLTLT